MSLLLYTNRTFSVYPREEEEKEERQRQERGEQRGEFWSEEKEVDSFHREISDTSRADLIPKARWRERERERQNRERKETREEDVKQVKTEET